MKTVCLDGTINAGQKMSKLKGMIKIDVSDNAESHHDFDVFIISELSEDFADTLVRAIKKYTKNPEATFICIPDDEFNRTLEMLEDNDIRVYGALHDLAEELNRHYIEIPLNQNMIECLIDRDGPTQVKLGHFTYNFEKNELGDSVCEVLSNDHRRHFLTLPDFRIYQEHLFPDPEFSKEEAECIKQWQFLGHDRFLAYVNGRIGKLSGMSNKLRKRLNEKWNAVMPKTTNKITGKVTQQSCPILVDLEEPELDESAFVNEWLRLSKNSFESYVKTNIQKFLECSDDVYDKAVAKWEKLISEPWPIEE